MSKALYIVAFIVGAGAGVAATQNYFRKKYAAKAEKDVENFLSTVSQYSEACEENSENASEIRDPEVEVKIPNEKPNIMDFYKEHVEKEGYRDYSTHAQDNNGCMDKVLKGEPYVIRPEEIGNLENEGYRTITLTLFDDDILTDDNYDRMDFDEIVACIGDDFKEHFGDYEDDAVHIRNDNLKIDYEILKDFRKYEEVTKFKPGSEE